MDSDTVHAGLGTFFFSLVVFGYLVATTALSSYTSRDRVVFS